MKVKKLILLINDERKKVIAHPEKGCSYYDVCVKKDNAHCDVFSVDYCAGKDLAGCTNQSTDMCYGGYDYAACYHGEPDITY